MVRAVRVSQLHGGSGPENDLGQRLSGCWTNQAADLGHRIAAPPPEHVRSPGAPERSVVDGASVTQIYPSVKRATPHDLRGKSAMARSPQALPHTVHDGRTHGYAPRIGNTGAPLLSVYLGVGVHQWPDHGVRGCLQGGSLAARVRCGRGVPRYAVAPSPLLDLRGTDAAEVCPRTRGAEPALAGLRRLWPSINDLGGQTSPADR
jgi:hypothetical protein